MFHEDFTDAAVTDPARLALAARVEVVADPECTAVFPHQFPAVLTIRLADGELREERVAHNRGGPENPLSPRELATKFRLNATRALDDAAARDLTGLVTRLGTDSTPAMVTELLRSVVGRKQGD